MEALTERKERILKRLDKEIKELEGELAEVQPLMDELNQLRRTRATLLSERTTTGNIGSRTRLTMESVIHALRKEGAMSVGDLAKALGVDETVVRSHLNRYKDTRYRKDEDGDWELIGEEE